MNKKFLIPLALSIIFLIALWLRLYRIDTVPLYADETSHYLGLHILSSSNSNLIMGLYNKLLYGSLSFTWLFGLSFWGVRFSSALFGSVMVTAAYLLARAVSRNKAVGFVAAILLAVTPWSFMLSRIGHGHITILVLLVIFQSYFFLRSTKTSDYFLNLLLLSLSLIFYPSMVIITPFFALLVLYYGYQTLPSKKRPLTLFTTIVCVSILLGIAVNRFNLFKVSGRALDLAIWRDVNTPWEIDKFRALSWNSAPSIFSFGLPPEQMANKLVYNRAMANASTFIRNYLSFFSPDWLFLKGDPILRHSTGMVGAFYPFLMPFMLYGAFRFFQTSDQKKKLTFLLWILISPIPAAITKDGAGYLLRVVTMLPFLTYFCALGIVDSFNLIHKRLKPYYFIFLSLIFIYSAYYFLYGYFHVYPALSARAYEYGFRELSDFQTSHENKTLLIVWDGYYHNNDFRFWQKTPFDQYESFKIKQIVIGESTFWQTYPNLYFSSPKSADETKDFIKQYHPDYIVLPDRYFVKYPMEIETLLTPIGEIKYPDQITALTIYTVR